MSGHAAEPFDLFLEQMRDIHRLFAAGKADTPEHDDLCDRHPDRLWYGMTVLEQKLVGVYSVALYGLAEWRAIKEGGK